MEHARSLMEQSKEMKPSRGFGRVMAREVGWEWGFGETIHQPGCWIRVAGCKVVGI